MTHQFSSILPTLGAVREALIATAPRLNPQQIDQVCRQILHHYISDPEVSVDVASGLRVDLSIPETVMRPFSSQILARYIWASRKSFYDRVVYDIGTGSGIQAIVSARAGARVVVATDISEFAVVCAQMNAERNQVNNLITTRCDLLEGISLRGSEPDIVVFAQPYFAGDAPPEFPASGGMLAEPKLVTRFLTQFRDRTRPTCSAFMLRWEFASPESDPMEASRCAGGLTCRIVHEEFLTFGVQTGIFQIVEIRHANS